MKNRNSLESSSTPQSSNSIPRNLAEYDSKQAHTRNDGLTSGRTGIQYYLNLLSEFVSYQISTERKAITSYAHNVPSRIRHYIVTKTKSKAKKVTKVGLEIARAVVGILVIIFGTISLLLGYISPQFQRKSNYREDPTRTHTVFPGTASDVRQTSSSLERDQQNDSGLGSKAIQDKTEVYAIIPPLGFRYVTTDSGNYLITREHNSNPTTNSSSSPSPSLRLSSSTSLGSRISSEDKQTGLENGEKSRDFLIQSKQCTSPSFRPSLGDSRISELETEAKEDRIPLYSEVTKLNFKRIIIRGRGWVNRWKLCEEQEIYGEDSQVRIPALEQGTRTEAGTSGTERPNHDGKQVEAESKQIS